MPLASYQSSSVKIWLDAWTPTIAEADALDDDVAPDGVRAAEELGAERGADDRDRACVGARRPPSGPDPSRSAGSSSAP